MEEDTSAPPASATTNAMNEASVPVVEETSVESVGNPSTITPTPLCPGSSSEISTLETKSSKLKDFSLSTTVLIPTIIQQNVEKILLKRKVSEEDEPVGKRKRSKSSDKDNDEDVKLESEQNNTEPPVRTFATLFDDEWERESEDTNNTSNSSPFVKAVIERIEQSKIRTENNAPTFATSGDARLDFFFGVMEQSTHEGTIGLFQKSWESNPTDTIKLLANLRDIRGGKGIRPQYQQCLYWLYENHPYTLYQNLSNLVHFGYWKDVLDLLVIVLFDGYMHPYFEKDANPNRALVKKHPVVPLKRQIKKMKRYESRQKRWKKFPKGFTKDQIDNAKGKRQAYDQEKRIYNQKIAEYYFTKEPELFDKTGFKMGDSVSKLNKTVMPGLRLKFAREKLESDEKYRVFHLKIAQIFAQQLILDAKELKKSDPGDKKKISLAGKWAPSLEAHFDKLTLIGSTIALEIAKQTDDIFAPRKSFPVTTYLARKKYHKDFCIPLRKYHEIPETKMSTNQWDRVNYTRVPAKCMQKNKDTFIKHDKERFNKFVSNKTSKVAGATLKPVELICEAMSLDQTNKDELQCKVIEKQWESLVKSLKGGGNLLKNAISICDVSGSMTGTPMQAAIGLTLITMSLTEEPWKICITFSQSPELFNLKDDLSLTEKIRQMKSMPWGMNTDLQKVFELILSLAEEKKLTDDQMPRLLLIFSDMEFDEACPGTNLTNFEAAKKLFLDKGYTMPAVVFWNLRDSCRKGRDGGGMVTSTPVRKNELGVSLISGFAAQTLKYVMKNADLSNCTPLQFMIDVLDDERYNKLAIFD